MSSLHKQVNKKCRLLLLLSYSPLAINDCCCCSTKEKKEIICINTKTKVKKPKIFALKKPTLERKTTNTITTKAVKASKCNNNKTVHILFSHTLMHLHTCIRMYIGRSMSCWVKKKNFYKNSSKISTNRELERIKEKRHTQTHAKMQQW